MKLTWLIAVVVGVLCSSLSSSAFAQATPPAPLETATPVDTALTLQATSTPQALPNDGRSEAVIEVLVTDTDKPLANMKVTAQTQGGGCLLTTQATTDSQGVARFQYRAGMQPEAGRVNFVVENAPQAQAVVEIPLAPVAYIDVELLTPEAYKAHRDRQVAAAPIYKLDVSGFPEQLAADGGSLAALSAVLTLIDGKPAPGIPLKVELASGDGQLQVDQTATDTSGRLRFYFSAGYTPGTATVRVTEPSTGLATTFNIVLVKAGPARIELYYLDPMYPAMAREGALLPADGMTGLPMVAKVTDLLGLPLCGAQIKLEIMDGKTGWIEALDPVSDAQGLVEFTYYSGGEPGKVRLRAFVASGMHIEADGTFLP